MKTKMNKKMYAHAAYRTVLEITISNIVFSVLVPIYLLTAYSICSKIKIYLRNIHFKKFLR